MQKQIADLIKEANGTSKGIQEKVYKTNYGVNRLADRLSQPDEYYYTLRNLYVTKENMIEQRNGYAPLTTTPMSGAPKIRKLFEFENKAGGKTIIGRGGTRWARYNGTDAWVDLDTSRAADAYGQICQFYYYGIMADGGRVRKFTSSWTVTDVDTTYAPTHTSCCHTHNHRLVINDDDNPLSFYLSKVDADLASVSDPFNTSGNDAAIINLAGVVPVGDKIIGFSTYLSTYLIVWLKRHIVVYDVPTTTTNVKLQQVIRAGCMSHDGLIYTDSGDILYPNESGYKSFIQSFMTQSILDIKDETALIGPYYKQTMASISNNQDIVGAYYSALGHAYFKIPIAGNPELWIMSEGLKTATSGKGNIAGFYTGIDPYSFLVDVEERLLFGGSDGHLYQMDSGTNDNGAAISVEAEKTGISFGNPSIFKKPKEFELVLEATGSVTVNLIYSFGTEAGGDGTNEGIAIVTSQDYWDVGLWDVAKWDASGQSLIRTRNLTGRGKYMNLKLSHATKDVQIRFPYWIVRYLNLGVD